MIAKGSAVQKIPKELAYFDHTIIMEIYAAPKLSKYMTALSAYTVKSSTYETNVSLPLKIANQSFCVTLQHIMMHHNTKFGNKMLCGLEGII